MSILFTTIVKEAHRHLAVCLRTVSTQIAREMQRVSHQFVAHMRTSDEQINDTERHNHLIAKTAFVVPLAIKRFEELRITWRHRPITTISTPTLIVAMTLMGVQTQEKEPILKRVQYIKIGPARPNLCRKSLMIDTTTYPMGMWIPIIIALALLLEPHSRSSLQTSPLIRGI